MVTFYDKIIDPSREKLSSEAAEVISRINRQQSPLLRLPAELRNKIYGYALGDLQFYMSELYRKQDILTTLSLDPPHHLIPLHRLIGLTLVSRQIYTETKLLPFELGTVHAPAPTFSHPIKRLSVIQRQAIPTIRMPYGRAVDRIYWELCSVVHWLTGVKRVVVFSCPYLQSTAKDYAVGVIQKGLGRGDVDIEFETGN